MIDETWFHIILFFIGLIILYLSGEGLIKSSVLLSRSFHIRAIIVGLTVVAFGTSAPELVVSLIATFKNNEDIALGNILGSIIANIGLVLGLSAIVKPLKVEMRLLKKEMGIMIGASILIYAMAWDGVVNRIDGFVLFGGIIGYLLYIYPKALKEPDTIQNEYQKFEDSIKERQNRIKYILSVCACCIALTIGAHLMITSGVKLAKAMGVSELIIGLTLVAVGTSLPEMATSMIASFRDKSDVSVGNIIGSNIFNIFLILGLISLIKPFKVEPQLLKFQFPAVVLFSLALIPIMKTGHVISRLEGMMLTGGYGIFIFLLFY
ncbi:MAG: calcium/sodium antiporter [Nitrospirota bacterium]